MYLCIYVSMYVCMYGRGRRDGCCGGGGASATASGGASWFWFGGSDGFGFALAGGSGSVVPTGSVLHWCIPNAINYAYVSVK